MSRISAEQMREDYVDKQMTIAAIAKKYVVSPSAVHFRLANDGIPRRKPGRRQVVTPSMHSRILAMRKGGYSIVDIGNILGVDKSAVWKFLKSKGLPMFWRRRAS